MEPDRPLRPLDRPSARAPALPVGQRRPDELAEERVRRHGPGLELGVELAAQEPGVVAELDDLHQVAVGDMPAEDQPLFLDSRSR